MLVNTNYQVKQVKQRQNFGQIRFDKNFPTAFEEIFKNTPSMGYKALTAAETAKEKTAAFPGTILIGLAKDTKEDSVHLRVDLTQKETFPADELKNLGEMYKPFVPSVFKAEKPAEGITWEHISERLKKLVD